MNCKQNDMALVVRSVMGRTCDTALIGTPLKVTDCFESLAGPAWLYSGPLLHCPSCGLPVFAFLDANLHPLRGQPLASEASVSEPIQGLTVIEEPMPCPS